MFTQWIHDVAPSPVTGPIEVVKERPWSLVAKVPTAGGLLWFKENRADTGYETYLLEALARWVPDAVLTPVAVDHARGWSLQPDGGATIHETTVRETGSAPDPHRWEELLSRHAELQRQLVVRTPDMLAFGVPDQRPDRLMAQFDRLAQLDELHVPAEVLALRSRLDERCAELSASAVPASLQHDDLHDNNVFAAGEVFDWGDASIAHPFAVLLVSLRVAAERLELDPGDPRLLRIRDAYVEPWSDLADRASMLRDIANALELAKIGRALAWRRAAATEADRAVLGANVTGWLRRLTEPEYS